VHPPLVRHHSSVPVWECWCVLAPKC